jgi:hypothetical protein
MFELTASDKDTMARCDRLKADKNQSKSGACNSTALVRKLSDIQSPALQPRVYNLEVEKNTKSVSSRGCESAPRDLTVASSITQWILRVIQE